MRRLNLNIEDTDRARVTAVAKVLGLRDGEAARELLLSALAAKEEELFLQACVVPPGKRKRLAEIARGMDKLRGR